MKSIFLLGLLLMNWTVGLNSQTSTKVPQELEAKPTLKHKGKEALQFCRTKDMNEEFCILIDMSKHSGLKRFYVWNFAAQKPVHSFLVSHGCCDNPWSMDYSKTNPIFSNRDGSHCSSLGKYKIGARGKSAWGIGINYLLHGLEKSNSNALKRAIVLHSWEQVPDEEVYPNGTPEGWGCPCLSNNNFRLLDPLLAKVSKPMLLWIYNDN